jgi:hypothetical protein
LQWQPVHQPSQGGAVGVISRCWKSSLHQKASPPWSLSPTQLFSGYDVAKANPYTPKATALISIVPSPMDAAPWNMHLFDGAAIHHPLAGLTRFSNEKKEFKAFDKKDHQHYIHGCLELQHPLLRSKTITFTRKNMEHVNEINDRKVSLKILTELTQVGHSSIPRSACHRTSLNIRNSWQLAGQSSTNTIRADINNIELHAYFEVAAKIRDCVLLEAKYLWEENAPKVPLALIELVLYVSDTIHANIPSIERWSNINEKERGIYSLVHLAKEISQNHTDFFPENLCCSYQEFYQSFAVSQNFGSIMQNVVHS